LECQNNEVVSKAKMIAFLLDFLPITNAQHSRTTQNSYVQSEIAYVGLRVSDTMAGLQAGRASMTTRLEPFKDHVRSRTN
jgi:hypothetical protein